MKVWGEPSPRSISETVSTSIQQPSPCTQMCCKKCEKEEILYYDLVFVEGMVNWLNSNQSPLIMGFHACVPHMHEACEPAVEVAFHLTAGLWLLQWWSKRRPGDQTRTDSDVAPSILQALRALIRAGMFVGQNKSR